MREIRFRAWQNTYGKMWTHKEIDDSDKDGVIMWGPIFNGKEGDFELMQYTGLKDRNGRRIYEGDVVKWYSLALPITVSETHGYRFMVGEDLMTAAYAAKCEVIGNIHENPELVPPGTNQPLINQNSPSDEN